MTEHITLTVPKGIPLSATEMRVYDVLYRNRDRWLTWEEILTALFDGDAVVADSYSQRYVWVLISRLRKCGIAIKTERGIGYALEAA